MQIKRTLKRFTMWLYLHDVVPVRFVSWMFRTFGLESA